MTKKVEDLNQDNFKNLLIETIPLIHNSEIAQSFLDDLLTQKEFLELNNRLIGAFLLKQNVTYAKIELLTGLSSTTIARIAKCLNRDQSGYQNILTKFELNNKR